MDGQMRQRMGEKVNQPLTNGFSYRSATVRETDALRKIPTHN
jgi:hypothetical protein